MNVFVFLVAVASILERNGTFQNDLAKGEMEINMAKTFLMFKRYQPILEEMVNKYGDFDKLNAMASDCYQLSGTATDMFDFNLILYGLETESKIKDIIRNIPDTNDIQLYSSVFPKTEQLMDKFIDKISSIQLDKKIDVSSEIATWKIFMKNALTQPISSSGGSCFKLVNLIEHNTELFRLYLRAMQEIPQSVLAEVVHKLVESMPSPAPFSINSEHEKLFDKIEREIKEQPMVIPDVTMEEKNLRIFELELKREKAKYMKYIDKSINMLQKVSSMSVDYIKKKSNSAPVSAPNSP